MTFMPTTRLAIMSAVLLLASAAQARDLDDAQLWTSYGGSGQIMGDLAGAFDVNARFTDTASLMGHFQVRGSLGWRISPGFILSSGYSYVRTESTLGRVSNEHRIFQQASHPLISIGTVALTGRTRLEQRMFDDVDRTGWRLRQQVRATVPLRGPEGLRAVFHTEAFFLLNQTVAGVPAGLNQIRTFAGLGMPLFGTTGMEAGYLNQAIFPGDDRHNHALSIGVSTAF
ncbi:MAG: DUF2490 domain-containing protein [Sandarakinorhabdus sp.]|nr:DUF2490 domain-containing protein [Sandarakinorhabdus sp.]MBS3962841.1 DUF2490 domain-containing protein [Sandarakinorhabdus sp.]